MPKDYSNLINECLNGNSIAQKKFYEDFSEVLYGISLRYSKNEEQAQDILQDSFLKIFNKLHTYKFTGSFEGWLKRITTNTAIEHYRKKVNLIDVEEVGYSPYLSINEERGLEVEELLKIIQDMPHGYRLVFNMYAIEGYSHSEIAEKLKISVGTSKSQLSRARAFLQDKIRSKYELPKKSIQPLEHFFRLLK